MRIVEITVTLNRKINLGNYESIDHFISAKAELHEGTMTELNNTYNKLNEEINKEMNAWVEFIKGNKDGEKDSEHS